MKKVNIGLAIAVVVCFLFGCSPNNKELNEVSEQKNLLSTETLKSNERQFIKKASIAMDVKNCLQTTNLIEQKAIAQKGFILLSEVKRTSVNESKTAISLDSLNQTNIYKTNAELVVRVPDTSLQRFLLYTETLGEHVKTRHIGAEDVSFDVLLNSLNNKTGSKEHLAINKNVDSELQKTVLTKNEIEVEDLRINDAIHFSTIGISMQQPEEVVTNTIANTENLWAKDGALLPKIFISLQKGFYALANIFIFCLQIWWVLPLLFFGRYAFRKFQKN